MTGHDRTTDLDPQWIEAAAIAMYGDKRLGERYADVAERALRAVAPLIAERAAAAERERIARAIEDSAAGHIGDEYHNAIDHAAAIARRTEND